MNRMRNREEERMEGVIVAELRCSRQVGPHHPGPLLPPHSPQPGEEKNPSLREPLCSEMVWSRGGHIGPPLRDFHPRGGFLSSSGLRSGGRCFSSLRSG